MSPSSEFTCDVLILAAFPPELEVIRRALGGASEASLPTASPLGAVRLAIATVGIGLPAAGAGAYARLAAVRPRAAVLIGTCGAYAGKGLGLLDVVASSAVGLADPAVAEGLAAFPGPMGRPFTTNALLAAGLTRAGAHHGAVATTLAVTTDDALAARIAEAFAADVEHLEAYAVATACDALAVPFAAVLGVANAVGARGRDEWRAHNVEAGARAADLVLRWVATGAEGLARAST